jgi:hypothetical protein
MQRRIREWLEGRSPTAFIVYAGLCSFTVYFCMYAFRKPFTAASFEDLSFLGSEVGLKTAFVLSQVVGYTLSKFIGIKYCSEIVKSSRARVLVGLVLIAELALLFFALVPEQWKILALFFNGLPLGMVWGLVVAELEGRRSSDVLLACLACSFILASGVVKDVGRYFMFDLGVSEWWMPAVTGLVFLPLLCISTWLLSCLPSPTSEDVALRSERAPMTRQDRMRMLKAYPLGWFLLIGFYLALTAVRDFRDNFGQEILNDLGLGKVPGVFSSTEMVVAFGVMLTMAALNVIKDNRRGFIAAVWVMACGMVVLGGGTMLFRSSAISGVTWMILTGLGSYLAYVPFNTILFERLMAYTRFSGTAVFAIYLADAAGYTGSIVLQLGKDLWAANMGRQAFFESVTLWVAVIGFLVCLITPKAFNKLSIDHKEVQV